MHACHTCYTDLVKSSNQYGGLVWSTTIEETLCIPILITSQIFSGSHYIWTDKKSNLDMARMGQKES